MKLDQNRVQRVNDNIPYLLLPDRHDVDSQQAMLADINICCNKLNDRLNQQSNIWDQLIRCLANQCRDDAPLNLLANTFNDHISLNGADGNRFSKSFSAWLSKSSFNKTTDCLGNYSPKFISLAIIRSLDKFRNGLLRDNTILQDEVLQAKNLHVEQKKLLSSIEQLAQGTADNFNQSTPTGHNYRYSVHLFHDTLVIQRNELDIQIIITNQAILNLETVIKNNTQLLNIIAGFLSPSLKRLQISGNVLWKLNKLYGCLRR
jgi:hypothetical protein